MAPTTRSARTKSSVTTVITAIHSPQPVHTLRNRQIPSVSPSPLPETELATPDLSTDDETMSIFPSKTLRGRNLEDLGELEEKGLLRRTSSSSSSGEAGLEDGVRRRGKEKESRVERVMETALHTHEEVLGLNNPRDRQAFGLLVILCKYFSTQRYNMLMYPQTCEFTSCNVLFDVAQPYQAFKEFR